MLEKFYLSKPLQLMENASDRAPCAAAALAICPQMEGYDARNGAALITASQNLLMNHTLLTIFGLEPKTYKAREPGC